MVAFKDNITWDGWSDLGHCWTIKTGPAAGSTFLTSRIEYDVVERAYLQILKNWEKEGHHDVYHQSCPANTEGEGER